MKWLLLIFSIFKPFFGSSSEHQMVNPIAEFKEMIKENAMKVVGVFAAASALATLFAAGLVIIAVDVGAQYDQNAYVYFSSMIMMGITLSVLSLIIAFGAAKIISNENTKPAPREVLQSVGTSHPLQDALALLIHDFVKEREMKRAQAEEYAAERSQRAATDERYHPSEESTHH
ncbi:hypothetical protein SHI21_05950 [Bacteriovorax sp. PP10]|uniref:Uncharacterized protein n=1 Tax=Bacteriovorax antarcticus TaxID=3088717 RepID=A0ABU5VRQ3_9BACT|nr:hypothetical protein [Bacteriovorax sp. PP10]MEA9355731.1 hypothetical protein [Bacteriovorax sp. PP10]